MIKTMKVNKIFKTAALVLCSAVLFSGCIKEVLPKAGSITQEQLADSDAGLEYVMKAIPAYMAASTAMQYDHSDFGYHSIGGWMDHHALTLFPCTRADRGGNPYYDRYQATNYGFDMSMNGGYTHYLWYNYYPLIKKSNEVIGAAGDQEDMIEYRAISKAFRALFYLDLARYYDALPAKAPELPTYEGDLVKVKELTVPIVTENTTEEAAKNNPRATREELFTFILADLADAEAIMKRFELDATTGEIELKATVYGSTPTYPDLAAVYGLYARAYLWLGGFDDVTYENVPTGEAAYRLAAEYARKAINTSNAPIMSENEWTNITTGFNTVVPAWMWATTLSSDTVLNNLFAFVAHMAPEATYGYAPLACPGVSSGMYDRMRSTDFRKKLIIGPNTSYDEFKSYTSMPREEWEELAYRAPYTNFKFRPFQGERVDYMTANAVSLPVMRIEEMYLIEAEATAHYDEATARNLIGAFMVNRDPNYFILPTQDVIDEIIFHKSVEFWGEGIILFDMKRLDMGVNTLEQNYPSGMLFKTDGRLPWWNMPVPSSESSVNTAVKGFEGPDPSYGVESEDAI